MNEDTDVCEAVLTEALAQLDVYDYRRDGLLYALRCIKAGRVVEDD